MPQNPQLHRYIVQLSFQSLPGVTTMAISAEIYPSMIRGTGAGISAAFGKVGAAVGSYSFSALKNGGYIVVIFWVVTITAVLSMVLTLLAIPFYNGNTLDAADMLTRNSSCRFEEAVRVLFSGPLHADGSKSMTYESDASTMDEESQSESQSEQ
eukprot:Skav230933  [mRNA]  locus=scaffold2774:70256:71353:- [translate_table: standard]